MSGIFISYRREDSQALAGRLFDRLTRRFGTDRVFRDIDAIDPGAKFAEVIGERIGGCDALVALIGKGWLEAKDAEGRRRLDLPGDFVKTEIAAALAQGKLVIPALIEGTTMPAREALPAEIAALAERNALPISDSRFDFDIGRLISVIDKAVAPERSAIASPSAPRSSGFWSRLSDTQRALAFLGAGIAAVGAAWTAYTHFSEKPTPPASAVSATQGGIAAGGNVTATAAQGGVAVVATGPVTIGITLAEYEERIKKRERDLREEFASTSRTDKDRIALLEKQLAAAETLARSPEQSLEKYKALLADASRSLQQLEPKVPAEELEGARQALARGDTAEAERLFQKLLAQDKVRAAEAAYQLGKLAESRIDYATAAKYFGEAVKLQLTIRVPQCSGRDAYTLAITETRNLSSNSRSRSGRKLSAPSIRTWRRASTTWRCSTVTRASTPRRSRSINSRSRSGRKLWAPSIRLWRRASTTWRFSTRLRASTPRPSRSIRSRSPLGRRLSAPSIPRWRRA